MSNNPSFETALELIEQGDVQKLQSLIQENPALATATDEGNATLLIHLIDWPGNGPNSAEIARVLVDAGADVEARRNDENGTPLSGALCTEDVGVISVLLDAGANIDAPCGWQTGTVLDQADQICGQFNRNGEEKIKQIAQLMSESAGRSVPARTPIGNPIPLLFVSDFDSSLKFYTERLGFRLAWRYAEEDADPNDPYASIVRGNTELHLTVCHCGGHAHVGQLYLRIHTPDVDRLHQELVTAEVPILFEPKTQPWDMRELAIEDADGNRFVFFNFVE